MNQHNLLIGGSVGNLYFVDPWITNGFYADAFPEQVESSAVLRFTYTPISRTARDTQSTLRLAVYWFRYPNPEPVGKSTFIGGIALTR